MMNWFVNPIYVYIIEALGAIHDMASAGVVLILFSLLIASIFCLTFFNDEVVNKSYKLGDERRLLEKEVEQTKALFITIRHKLQELKNEDDREKLDKLTTSASEFCNSVKKIQESLEYRNLDLVDIYSSYKTFKKVFKYLFIALIITIIIKIFVPSADTGYKILLANLITPENVHMTLDSSKEYINWAIQSLVNSITNMR